MDGTLSAGTRSSCWMSGMWITGRFGLTSGYSGLLF